MTDKSKCGPCGLIVLCLLASVPGLPTDVRAEMGAGSGLAPSAPAFTVYVLGAISEDPEPVGSVWRPLGPPAAGRVVLNPQGETNGDGPPSFVVDPVSGLVATVWSRNSATGFDVVISQFDGVTWSTPQTVVGVAEVDELDPQIVAGSDGSLHVFYWVDGPTPRVFYTSAPAGLADWSVPIPVSPPGAATCRPAAAYSGEVLRVVYENHEFGYGNSPRQIVIARYEGGAFITEVVAMTNHLGDVKPQVHSHGGKLWVDWIDTETTGNAGELAWTRLDSQGQWEAIQYQSFENLEQREYLVRGSARMLAIQP